MNSPFKKKIRFGFTGESEFIIKASRGFSERFYLFATVLGTALLSLGAGYVPNSNLLGQLQKASVLTEYCDILFFSSWFLIILGIVFLFVGFQGTYHDFKNLSDQNDQLKIENLQVPKLKRKIEGSMQDCEQLMAEKRELHKKLVKTWLEGISKQLDLGTKERVTLYYVYSNAFCLLARYSINPELDKEHRQKFPTDKGVISRAWKYRECIDIDECPNYYENVKDYTTYLKKVYGLNHEKLTMKSCAYCGLAINDAGKNIGVILFESENKNTLTLDKIDSIKKLCENYQSHMSEFIRDAINIGIHGADEKAVDSAEKDLLEDLEAQK